MKPKNSMTGVVLEGRKDRRYAKAAANRVDNPEMRQHIINEANQAWRRLYRSKYTHATGSDLSDARLWGWALDHRFTEFKSDEGVRKEISERHANENLPYTPTELSDRYTVPLARGLIDIADGGRIRAAMQLTRIGAARRMLEQISPLAEYVDLPVYPQPEPSAD